MNGIKIGLGIAILTAFTGCVGYVGPDGGEVDVAAPDVYVPGPDFYIFGGSYERGHDVHAYSNRGFESRAVAHPEIRAQARSAPAHAEGGGPESRH